MPVPSKRVLSWRTACAAMVALALLAAGPLNAHAASADLARVPAPSTAPYEASASGVAEAPRSPQTPVDAAAGSAPVAAVAAGQFIESGVVTVGDGPVGVVLAPDGRRAYVTDYVDGTVSVVDTSTWAVTATIPVGTQPYRAVVTPNGAFVYVALFGVAPGEVVVIDTATDAVVKKVSVGSGGGTGIAMSPDGARVYVPDNYDDTVSVIDVATQSEDVGARMSLGVGDAAPWDVAVSSDGKTLYATSTISSDLVVVDIASKTVAKTIFVGSEPRGVTSAPDGRHVYVVSRSPASVAVVDAVAGSVVATIGVGPNPYEVAVAADGLHAFVPSGGDDTVSVLDLQTNSVAYTTAVGSSPQGVAVAPDGNRVLVTNTGKLVPGASHALSVLERATVPAFTSPDATGGTAGQVFTEFPITVTGNPAPTMSTPTKPSEATKPGKDSLPKGLSLNTAKVPFGLTGTIDASVEAGEYSFGLQAANGVSPDATQTLTITVAPVLVAPAFTSPNVAAGTAGQVFRTFTLAMTGNPAPTLSTPLIPTPEIMPGADRFPKGLTVNTTTAPFTITGTIDPKVQQGWYTFKLLAVNGVSPDAYQQLRVVVVAPTHSAPVFTSPDATAGTAGQKLRFLITVEGDPDPALSTPNGTLGATVPGTDRLPKGLTLNTGTTPA